MKTIKWHATEIGRGTVEDVRNGGTVEYVAFVDNYLLKCMARDAARNKTRVSRDGALMVRIIEKKQK